MRKCQKCKVTKPLTEFGGPWKSGEYDGYCKPCRKAYNRAYYEKKKSREHKTPTSKKCSRCGRNRRAKYFPKCGKSDDGLYSMCLHCKATSQRIKTARGLRRPFDPPAEKACLICGETKPWRRFSRRASNEDGLNDRCKDCLNAKEAKRRKKRNNPVSVEEKHCYWCFETKPASEFFRDKQRPDGLHSACKECCVERNRIWRHKKAGKEEAQR